MRESRGHDTSIHAPDLLRFVRGWSLNTGTDPCYDGTDSSTSSCDVVTSNTGTFVGWASSLAANVFWAVF